MCVRCKETVRTGRLCPVRVCPCLSTALIYVYTAPSVVLYLVCWKMVDENVVHVTF